MRISKLLLIAIVGIGLSANFACERPESVETTPPPPNPHYTAEEIAVLQEHLDLPSQPFPYSFNPAPHMGTVGTAEISVARATLGRVLFYDKALSKDQTVSCASCHQQSLAFADDKAFSDGIENRKTARNSIGMGSFASVAMYYNTSLTAGNNLFWDGRAHSFVEQMEQTITNPAEMGMSLVDIIDRIEDQPYYEILFRKAFDSGDINVDHMMQALGDFMFAINSTNTRLDEALNLEGVAPNIDYDKYFSRFNNMENQGKALFLEHCMSCHESTITPPNFIVFEHANNGLAVEYVDKGVGAVSGKPSENGSFKIPSLRNIELTGPYMHDGRFETLEEVIDFYSTGIKEHPNLDHRLKKNGQAKKMNFTAEDKAALLAFLKTMTDYQMITEEKFADPFLQ